MGAEGDDMNEETRNAVQGFHDALNSHDIDALALLVHEDCVFETTDPPDGTRHVGRAAVLKTCQDFFDQSPRAHFEMEEITIIDDRAVVRWRYEWADGHVRGVDLVRVRDHQVVETFAYVKG
jgi:ketosteroid isomerase-like protein